MERIRTHEYYLVERLIESLSNIPGLILYTARDGYRQTPVVSCNIQGHEPGEVGAILDQAFDIRVRTGLHCAPAAHKTFGTFPLGTIRLSPGYFNTTEEIDFTLEAIERIARSKSLQEQYVGAALKRIVKGAKQNDGDNSKRGEAAL